MQYSPNTVCYEAIQVLYRNAVVSQIRQRLQAAYPNQWQEKLRKPFQKEWDAVVEAANETRLTGELSSQVRDDFDYLGVNHFGNLFEAYFDPIFPQSTEMGKEARSKERQAILRWAGTIKRLRDPLSHPVEEPFGFEDALGMVDAARRIVEKFDQVTAARLRDVYEDLRRRDAPQLTDRPPRLPGFLPPRETIAVDFIGRRQELEELDGWFRDPLARLWVLAGDGGKGKTSIAYRFAEIVRSQAPKEYALVAWLSAKQRRFQEGRTIDIISNDFHDLGTAVDRLLAAYGQSPPVQSTLEQRKSLVTEQFKQFPGLIVVDDLDSLDDDDPAVYFFAHELPMWTESKILITSRRALYGLAQVTTQVRGLNDADGHVFVQSRLRLMQLDEQAFSRKTIGDILSVCESSPLFVEDLLRLCAAGVPPEEAVAAWRERDGDAAREYALRREFERLSQDAKRILLACALMPGPVSAVELQEITGLTEQRFQTRIGELRRLFLVPTPRFVEAVARFEVNRNTAQLVSHVLASTEIYRDVEAAVRSVRGQFARRKPVQLEVEQRVRQAVFLARAGRFPEAEATLRDGLKMSPNDPDLYGQLARIYKFWGHTTDARDHFRRAAQLKCQSKEMYRQWWQLERRELEWRAAAIAAERGLQIHKGDADLLFLAGYARSQLGRALLSSMHYDRALVEFGTAVEYLVTVVSRASGRDQRDRVSHSHAYRDLVVCLERQVLLLDPAGAQSWQPGAGHDDRERMEAMRRYEQALDKMRRYALAWIAEHPDDALAHSEFGRLRRKFPGNWSHNEAAKPAM